MLTKNKIHPALEKRDIDVLIASTDLHVFYTTGLYPSTTVTPHRENFEETGYYYDSPPSPPKCFGIWSVEYDRPLLVLPPVSTTQLADHGLDIQETYVYSPSDYMINQRGALSDGDMAVVNALEETHRSIFDALFAALEPLVDTKSRVAVEVMSLSPAVSDRIRAGLDVGEITEATEILHELRQTKTEREVERLRTAAKLNESAIDSTANELEAGMTELEAAEIFRREQCREGAAPGHTMIGFGEHSAYAHASPGERTLEDGDLVRFEVGLEYEHYPADLARTYAFRTATEAAEQQYAVVYAAMEECASQLRDGILVKDVHEASMQRARDVASDLGVSELENWTRRHIGHNIGLDVHDHPLLSASLGDFGGETLRSGMVMNYEAAYLTLGWGGVQIEDTALVTDDGIEAFTSSPATLPIIG